MFKMRSMFAIIFLIKLTVGTKDSTCGVVPITQWGGSSLIRAENLPGPVSIVVIQHTATAECVGNEDCERTASSIRQAQINRGFDDIGPSFLIGGNGKVYEGAGWRYVGAHTRGYNRRAIGITFIGDFRNCLPSPLAQKALRKLLECGVENKYLTDGYYMVAHSQLSNTESPGDMLRKQVEQWPHWLDHAKEMLG